MKALVGYLMGNPLIALLPVSLLQGHVSSTGWWQGVGGFVFKCSVLTVLPQIPPRTSVPQAMCPSHLPPDHHKGYSVLPPTAARSSPWPQGMAPMEHPRPCPALPHLPFCSCRPQDSGCPQHSCLLCPAHASLPAKIPLLANLSRLNSNAMSDL